VEEDRYFLAVLVFLVLCVLLGLGKDISVEPGIFMSEVRLPDRERVTVVRAGTCSEQHRVL
jgi:hypothetical protein